MSSYAFFFNSDTFDWWRDRVRSGLPVPLDCVGAAAKRPFTDIAAGDELFIVGLKNARLHLAGRLIASGSPVPWETAAVRLATRELIAKPLICIADPAYLDHMRPDLIVPDDVARSLELERVTGEPLDVSTLRAGHPDPNLFRSCPRLLPASADVLRTLLFPGAQQDVDTEDSNAESDGVDDDEYRQCAIKTRRGQTRFRQNLMQAYGRKCVVTACGVEPLLEAAHITPHAALTDYRVCNGLLLRADIHTLFDEDLLVIEDRYRVRVSPSLRYSEYWAYDGRQLHRLPERSSDQPDRDALRARVARLKT